MKISPHGNSVTASQDEIETACGYVGFPVLLKKKGSRERFTLPVTRTQLDQTLNLLGLWDDDEVIVRHAH